MKTSLIKNLLLLNLFLSSFCVAKEIPFFQARKENPQHISIGAVLYNKEGLIACHHFKEIGNYKDVYILMRESMENDETVFMTLERGLKEEFGASGKPIAFLGCLSGPLPAKNYTFEKTTLYVACEMISFDKDKRDPNDPEASSIIEWLKPEELISHMQRQGKLTNRIDADESEMIKRALPYIKQISAD